ncbi:predicted protein [Uncinocarpus reesii 1704]|uniref:Amino acid permease/ SLC12A domain-containing protein n=1 Tax=Uncinocarpus reesii (strain UAMH 1704) TaxID=336963 RepID=C4JSN3_UNCRE|nr:uncharacterized protein UREG_05472 [Uncinocarpus reesii 1704]EEP80630.1 predicted protein [Uncinocarpus reesii 1704]
MIKMIWHGWESPSNSNTSNLGLVNGGRGAMVSPTSGGQYHWVSEYASPRFQKFLSYITGWLSVLGWQAAFASITFLCGTLIQGFIAANSESYTPERWHGTLLTFAIALLSTFINTYAAGQLPSLEGLILIVHVFGFFATMIPLWVMGEKADAATVFTEFTNAAEWPNLGLAVLVGQITPIFSFLAEEIQDASRIVPWCMVATAIINGTLGFLILITYLFTMGDIQTVLNAPSGFAFISAYQNALGSAGGAIGLASLILILEVCSAISILATCSRQTFAFARDNALPFSRWFANMNPKSKIPVNAVVFTTVVTLLLSLINIGSTEAFNAVASLTVGSLYLSYIICVGSFIARRLQSEPLPRGRFSLGKFGMPINVFAFFYMCFAIVFTFFPNKYNVTPASMNWSILICGVVIIFAIVQYMIHGKKTYEAPVTHVKKAE